MHAAFTLWRLHTPVQIVDLARLGGREAEDCGPDYLGTAAEKGR